MRMTQDGLFIYCQSAFGVGHFVRTARLINAVRNACPSIPISLFHGGRSTAFLHLSGSVKTVELEPLTFTSINGSLSALDGSDPKGVLLRRKAHLTQHLLQLRPRAVLFEHFPFGRWGFSEEILPFIECCCSLNPPPLLWSSVRDVPILSEYDYFRMLGVIQHFHRVFVHSDPNAIPFDLGRPIPRALAARIEYTGYVSPTDNGKIQRGTYVLVHSGGGYDGQAFWEAVNSFRVNMSGVQFKTCGQDPVELMDLVSTMRLLRSAWRSISMAGYNTVAEWLAFRTPTIFVPRRSDTEQLKRLHSLHEFAGGPMVISDPTPEGLRSAWDDLSNNEPFRANIWIKGQEKFASAVKRYLG